jgi:catechol 2,3-dioxygenase-like lactoylglutathione lyase family enzyme
MRIDLTEVRNVLATADRMLSQHHGTDVHNSSVQPSCDPSPSLADSPGAFYASPMLLSGFNHVAILTNDTDRLHAFYREVFEADIHDGEDLRSQGGPRLSFVNVGPTAELNVFQFEGNTEADRQTPMFGRGRLDHMALQASSLENFEELRRRLIERGAADDFVTDFGPILSVFWRDPDGLECELTVPNPDDQPGVSNPPGTRAARYPAA